MRSQRIVLAITLAASLVSAGCTSSREARRSPYDASASTSHPEATASALATATLDAPQTLEQSPWGEGTEWEEFGGRAYAYRQVLEDPYLLRGHVNGMLDFRPVPTQEKEDPFDAYPVILQAGQRISAEISLYEDDGTSPASALSGVGLHLRLVKTQRGLVAWRPGTSAELVLASPVLASSTPTANEFGGSSAVLDWVAESNGEYALVAYGVGSRRLSDNYWIDSLIDAGDDAIDNRFPGAEVASPVIGSLDREVDPTDCYAIHVKKGQMVVAWTDFPGPDIALYGPKGRALSPRDSYRTMGDVASAVANADGTYSIKVSGGYGDYYELTWIVGAPSRMTLTTRRVPGGRYRLSGRVYDSAGKPRRNRLVQIGLYGEDASWGPEREVRTDELGRYACTIGPMDEGYGPECIAWSPGEAGYVTCWAATTLP